VHAPNSRTRNSTHLALEALQQQPLLVLLLRQRVQLMAPEHRRPRLALWQQRQACHDT
jgi:hypothetical protein